MRHYIKELLILVIGAILLATVGLALLPRAAFADEGLYRWWAREQAIEYGLPVPEWFENQIYAESKFNPRAVSSRGARGIAQIMPQFHDVDVDDPWESIRYAAWLMSGYYQRFDYRYELALSAYASGPAAVARCWCIPNAESRWYVHEVMK